jgi:hypothetical protein
VGGDVSALDTWAIEECIDYGAFEAPAYDPPIENQAREQLRALQERATADRQALVAMVYVHHCNCGEEIPKGRCARCRAVAVLGFDPTETPSDLT